MKEPGADSAIKKIPCDGCRKMIPKGMALTVESWDRLRYFVLRTASENGVKS